MSRRVTDAQPGFAGGLNLTADQSKLAENELRLATNIRLGEDGGATKRRGTRRVNDAALAGGAPIRGGLSWRKPSSVEEVVVAGGHLHTGAFAFGMSWTPIAGTLSLTQPAHLVHFRDGTNEVVYLADGGPLNKYDGSTLAENIADTGTPARLAVYNRRLLSCSGLDQAIDYSALENGDTLAIGASGGGRAIVRTFGDQRVRNVVTVGGSLFIIHDTGISRFTGWTQDDISIQSGAQGVTGRIGSVSPRSAIVTEADRASETRFSGVYFAAQNGIYRVGEAGDAVLVSHRVRDLWRRLTLTQLEGVIGQWCDEFKECWWTIPNVGVLVYNTVLDAWSGPWTGVYLQPTTAMWETLDANGRTIILTGSHLGHLHQADVFEARRDDLSQAGTDGVAFRSELGLRRLFAGFAGSDKSWRWGYLLANPRGSSGMRVEWRTPTDTDEYPIESVGGKWGAFRWGKGSARPFRIPMSGRGAYVDVTVLDDGFGESVVSSFTVEGFDYGRRG